MCDAERFKVASAILPSVISLAQKSNPSLLVCPPCGISGPGKAGQAWDGSCDCGHCHVYQRNDGVLVQPVVPGPPEVGFVGRGLPGLLYRVRRGLPCVRLKRVSTSFCLKEHSERLSRQIPVAKDESNCYSANWLNRRGD